jgi:hypothetical protein
MAKTMETSRDDEHNEDVVPWSMFETLWEGVHREMRRGHRRRRPPPEDEAHPAWLSSLSTSDGASPRDVARTTVTTKRGTHL